ncbi:MAG: hypothetical protein K1060chlam5_00020 [Candidatus Anoxychlamydiales bacterium]|nr:hypothetical protein [Candidatus Anoxychlamydiales bacterium]
MFRIISLVLLIIIFNSNIYAKNKMQDPINIKKETVVCIHGFYRSKLNMIIIAKAFRKKGYDVLNYGYPSRKKKIEDLADDLVEKLILISKKNPSSKISFVTHSMGGLVLRSAVNKTNCPMQAKIGKAVLLAPPNKGAIIARQLKKYRLARLFFGKKAGRELMNYENFDHLGIFPKEIDVLVIAGNSGINPLIGKENDGKVAVEETCLSTSHKHIVIKSGHALIAYNKNVIRHAMNFINQ